MEIGDIVICGKTCEFYSKGSGKQVEGFGMFWKMGNRNPLWILFPVYLKNWTSDNLKISSPISLGNQKSL